jgi:small subunit ribosomal protein S6e
LGAVKVIISDPETGRSQSIELEEEKMRALVGKRIGDVVDGSVFNLPSYELRITGGSDKSGFPMRPGVHGGGKVQALLSGGVGHHPKRRGERRRKTVRGEVVMGDLAQLNLKIVKRPKRP